MAIRRIFGSDADSDSYKNPLKKPWIFHGFRILGNLADCGFSDSVTKNPYVHSKHIDFYIFTWNINSKED